MDVTAAATGQDPGIALLIDPSVPPVTGAYRLEIEPTGITRGGARPRRTALRRDHALAIDRRRQRRAGRLARHAHRRRAALRLAWADARLRAALPVARIHRALHRLDGAAQAQRAALAPDRRPGLAARDHEVPAAHLGWRLARAGRACGGSATSTRPPAGRASTAGTTRRTRCAASCATRPIAVSPIVPEIEMPGHATAAIAAYPALGVNGSGSAAVPADWGIYPNLFNVEDATFAFLEDVLREVMELFPGQYIHVGGDEAVKDQWQSSRARAAADARARNRRRARAAELLRAAHRPLSRRERAAAHRLGRDPRRRPRTGCDRDVLARHRWCARRGRGGSRRGAFAVAHVVLRQSAGHRHHRAARPRPRHRPRDRVSLRPDAAGAAARAASSHPRRAGKPLDRAHPHRGPASMDGVPARRGGGRGRLVAARSASTMRISTGG